MLTYTRGFLPSYRFFQFFRSRLRHQFYYMFNITKLKMSLYLGNGHQNIIKILPWYKLFVEVLIPPPLRRSSSSSPSFPPSSSSSSSSSSLFSNLFFLLTI